MKAETTIVRRLTRHSLSLCAAESCTGGFVAERITSVPGASACFEGGFVTYSNAAKTRLIGVPEELIAKHGAVSSETARAMAEGPAKNWVRICPLPSPVSPGRPGAHPISLWAPCT